jgi:hypothetical protein
MSNDIRLSLTISALALSLAIVPSVASLTQSVDAFPYTCLDAKSDGKAPMTFSGNNLYVAWWGNGTGNYEVMFKASNDNGQTFGDKINLSNSTNGTSVGAAVAASGNNVYVTYWDNKTGTGRVYLKTSTDNGKTFGPEIVLTDTPSNVAPYPQTKEVLAKLTPHELKIAAGGNNVYVTANGAESLDNITSPSDIFIRTSNDNGKSFGETINLSNSKGIQSIRAEIEASGDNVSVSWWEKSGGKEIPMIRTSNDGGKTFGEAVVLTANSTSSLS